VRLQERLRHLEEKAAERNSPALGPLVLMEGVDGTREHILERCKALRSESRKGPLIIFAADRPTSSPLA
jgi:hypothetical protein